MKPLLLHRWLEQARDPLWARARRLLAWQEAVAGALPPELRGAVVVAGWRDGVLELACSSGAEAARVRQAAPQLAQNLGAVGEVRHVRVTVKPHLRVAGPIKKMREALPETAVQALEQASQGIAESPLKDVLARMAARHRLRGRSGR